MSTKTLVPVNTKVTIYKNYPAYENFCLCRDAMREAGVFDTWKKMYHEMCETKDVEGLVGVIKRYIKEVIVV